MLASSSYHTSSATLTTNIAKPFLEATRDSFQQMLNVSIVRRSLTLWSGSEPQYSITAMIGLSGDATGSVCLCFKEETAFRVVQRLVDVEPTEVNALVCDAMGELANIIAGSAKDRIKGMRLELGLPNVIRGDNVSIEFPSCSQPMCLSFDSELGPFAVVFGFAQR